MICVNRADSDGTVSAQAQLAGLYVMRKATHLGAVALVALLTQLTSTWSLASENFDKRAETIDSQELGVQLTRDGWQRLGFDDVPNTEFERLDDSIRIEAVASNALIYRKLTQQETGAEVMSWSWRVDSRPPSKSLKKVDDDDRAIAVYVIFEIDSRKLSWWGRLRSSLVARFSGLPRGQILTYVWGSDDAIGEWFANPYIRGTGRVKVLRNATHSLGVWQHESVDLTEDFVAAFGYEPIKPVYIALSADTEDSGTRSLSWISDIRLVAPETETEPETEPAAVPAAVPATEVEP